VVVYWEKTDKKTGYSGGLEIMRVRGFFSRTAQKKLFLLDYCSFADKVPKYPASECWFIR
jgi:hypothetical protein